MITHFPQASSGASAEAVPAELLIGREKLVNAVIDHVQDGRSVLLVEAAGMGKTAILHAVAQRMLPRRTSRTGLYCGEAGTLRKTLQSLAEGLYDRQRVLPAVTTGPRTGSRHTLARLPMGKLRRFVLPYLGAGRCMPLLDHLGSVRGTYATFLDNLVEDLGVPIVVAARSLSPDDTGRLWWITWNFSKVDVAPLDHIHAQRLIDSCLDRARLRILDRQDFARGVLKRADGNPHIITRLCEMAGSRRYQIHGRTNLRLLWLDFKILELGLGSHTGRDIPSDTNHPGTAQQCSGRGQSEP